MCWISKRFPKYEWDSYTRRWLPPGNRLYSWDETSLRWIIVAIMPVDNQKIESLVVANGKLLGRLRTE